jgi:hypothetical protein
VPHLLVAHGVGVQVHLREVLQYLQQQIMGRQVEDRLFELVRSKMSRTFGENART